MALTGSATASLVNGVPARAKTPFSVFFFLAVLQWKIESGAGQMSPQDNKADKHLLTPLYLVTERVRVLLPDYY